ncbi:MAG: hypothetical protein IKC51_02650, partial [Myxococcaceae bacterium]|nr:hypothetical protein [Myxococcaceae bacterium]
PRESRADECGRSAHDSRFPSGESEFQENVFKCLKHKTIRKRVFLMPCAKAQKTKVCAGAQMKTIRNHVFKG